MKKAHLLIIAVIIMASCSDKDDDNVQPQGKVANQPFVGDFQMTEGWYIEDTSVSMQKVNIYADTNEMKGLTYSLTNNYMFPDEPFIQYYAPYGTRRHYVYDYSVTDAAGTLLPSQFSNGSDRSIFYLADGYEGMNIRFFGDSSLMQEQWGFVTDSYNADSISLSGVIIKYSATQWNSISKIVFVRRP